jgi:flagellar basal-body rod modification protein FlgD
MTSIDPNLYLSTTQAKKQLTTGSANLGKDDFLKILMVQLQNQDPTKPLEDKDFIAQMATFSSLEQMTNMATSMQKLMDSQQQSQLMGFNSFMGKEVSWNKVNDSSDPDSVKVNEGRGVVTSIAYKGDTVEFTLEDGTKLTPANISVIHGEPSGNPLLEASQLIGKKVSWEVDGSELSGNVQSVSKKDGNTFVHINNGEKINANQLMKIE